MMPPGSSVIPIDKCEIVLLTSDNISNVCWPIAEVHRSPIEKVLMRLARQLEDCAATALIYSPQFSATLTSAALAPNLIGYPEFLVDKMPKM